MKNGFIAAVAAWFLASGLALAQPETSPPLTPVPEPQAGGDSSPSVVVGAPVASPSRLWANADLLLWWIKNSQMPPLVTAGTVSSRGISGQNGTTPLFGGNVENEDRLGGRFNLGWWLDDGETVGIEGGYLFLASRSVHFGAGSNGGQVLARPFFNVNSGAEDSELVSFPGILGGRTDVVLNSRLEGAELNVVTRLSSSFFSRLELLAGFRYLYLNEGLGISENLQGLPGGPEPAGTTFRIQDQFGAINHFYGGQIGARGEIQRGNWFATLSAKVALGCTQEQVAINGSTVTVTPPVSRLSPGGLLALPSNRGHFSQDSFAVVPEVGFNVGYRVTSSLKVFVGYTFLYWSDVARPGDQIDRTLNPTQIPSNSNGGLVGPARPAFTFKHTDFWAQGINFGLELRY